MTRLNLLQKGIRKKTLQVSSFLGPKNSGSTILNLYKLATENSTCARVSKENKNGKSETVEICKKILTKMIVSELPDETKMGIMENCVNRT